LATRIQRLNLAQACVRLGANVNTANSRGDTCLHVAVRCHVLTILRGGNEQVSVLGVKHSRQHRPHST
jgi:hypothetical protein